MKLYIKEFYKPAKYKIVPSGSVCSAIQCIENKMFLKPIDSIAEVEFDKSPRECCKLLINRSCFKFDSSLWVYPNDQILSILRALEIL